MWNDPTNRTVYQWSEASKTKEGVQTTKTSVWSKTVPVRNRIRQKAGEIEAGSLETFTGDWCLREGESRDKVGEWLKTTTVRSTDQRRMIVRFTSGSPCLEEPECNIHRHP